MMTQRAFSKNLFMTKCFRTRKWTKRISCIGSWAPEWSRTPTRDWLCRKGVPGTPRSNIPTLAFRLIVHPTTISCNLVLWRISTRKIRSSWKTIYPPTPIPTKTKPALRRAPYAIQRSSTVSWRRAMRFTKTASMKGWGWRRRDSVQRAMPTTRATFQRTISTRFRAKDRAVWMSRSGKEPPTIRYWARHKVTALGPVK